MQELPRRKVLFLMAFLSVFLSTTSSMLIDVISKKGALIFVKMSETMPVDAVIRAGMKNRDKKENDFRLNFT